VHAAFSRLPLLIVQHWIAISAPVSCHTFQWSVLKLYFGVEKRSQPRQFVCSANGNWWGPCWASHSHVPITLTRTVGLHLKQRNRCRLHICPNCELSCHPGMELTRPGMYIGMLISGNNTSKQKSRLSRKKCTSIDVVSPSLSLSQCTGYVLWLPRSQIFHCCSISAGNICCWKWRPWVCQEIWIWKAQTSPLHWYSCRMLLV